MGKAIAGRQALVASDTDSAGKGVSGLRNWLLAIVVMALTGCAALEQARWQEPELRLEQVELMRLTPTNAELVGHFTVNNPNGFGVSMGALDYRLSMNESEVLAGVQEQGQRLEAGAETQVSVPLVLSFAELATLVQGFSSQSEIDYELAGGMRFEVPVAGSIRVPARTTGSLPVPRLPTVSIQGLKVEQVSLSGAAMVLSLQLNNPNVFELLIEDLSYELALEHEPVASGTTRQRVRLAAESDGLLEIPLEVSFLAAGRSLYMALETDQAVAYGLSIDSDFGTSIPQMSRFPFSAIEEGQIRLGAPG